MPKQKNNAAGAAAKMLPQKDYIAEFCYKLKSDSSFSDFDPIRVQAFITLLEKIPAITDPLLHKLVKASTNKEDAAALLALLATTAETKLAQYLKGRQLPWLILLSSIVARGQTFLDQSYQAVYNTVHQVINSKIEALKLPQEISKLFDSIRNYSPFVFLYDKTLTENIFALIERYQLEEPTQTLIGQDLLSIGCHNNNIPMLRYVFSHRLFPDDLAQTLSFSGRHHAPLALAGLETHPTHAEAIKTKLQEEYRALTAEAATMNPHVALSIWALLQQLYPQSAERPEQCAVLMTALAEKAATLSLTEMLTDRLSNLPLILWLQNQAAFVATAKQIPDLTPLLVTHTDIDRGSQQILETCATLELLEPNTFIQRILIKFALVTRGLDADKITAERVLPYLKLLLCVLKHPTFVINESYLQQVILLAVVTNQTEDLNQLAQLAPDLFKQIIRTAIPENALSKKFNANGVTYIDLALRHPTAECAPLLYQTLVTQNTVTPVSRPAHLLSTLVIAKSFSGILALLRKQPHFFIPAPLRSALFELYDQNRDTPDRREIIARTLINIGYLLHRFFHLQQRVELPWKDPTDTADLLLILIQYLEQLPEAMQAVYRDLLAASRKNLDLIELREKTLTKTQATFFANSNSAHTIAQKLHELTTAPSDAALRERQLLIEELETLLLHLPERDSESVITAHPCQIANQSGSADFIALLCLGGYTDLVKLALLCMPNYLFSAKSCSTNILSAVCAQGNSEMADIIVRQIDPNFIFDLLSPPLSPSYFMLSIGLHPSLTLFLTQWKNLADNHDTYLDTISPLGLLQLLTLLHRSKNSTADTTSAEEEQRKTIELTIQQAFKRQIPEDTRMVSLADGTTISLRTTLAIALAEKDSFLIDTLIDSEYLGKIPDALRPQLFDLLLIKPYEPLWLKLKVTPEELLTAKESAPFPATPFEYLLAACTASQPQKNSSLFGAYLQLVRESILVENFEAESALFTEFLVLMDHYLTRAAEKKLTFPPNFRENIYTKLLEQIAYNPQKIIWGNLDPHTPVHLQRLLIPSAKNPAQARLLLQIDRHLFHQRLKNLSLTELLLFVPNTLQHLSRAEDEIYQPYVRRALVAAHSKTTFQLAENHFLNHFFVASVLSSGVTVTYENIPIQYFCRLLAQDNLLVDVPILRRAIQTRMTHLTTDDQVGEALQILCEKGEQALATELVTQQQVPLRLSSTALFNNILKSSCVLNCGADFFQPLMSAFLQSDPQFNSLALGTESGFSPFAMVMIDLLANQPEDIPNLLAQMLPNAQTQKGQFKKLSQYSIHSLLQLIQFSRRCQAAKLKLKTDVQQYLKTLELKAYTLLTEEHKENYLDLLVSTEENHFILSIFAINTEEFLDAVGGHHIDQLFFMAICYGHHNLLDIVAQYLQGKHLSFNPYAEKIWLDETVAKSPVAYLYTRVQTDCAHSSTSLKKLFHAFPPTESQRATWAKQLKSSAELLIALYHHAEEKQQAELINYLPAYNFIGLMKIALTLKQERFIAFLLNSLFAAKTAATIPLFQLPEKEQLEQFNLSELTQLNGLQGLSSAQRRTIASIEEARMQNPAQPADAKKTKKPKTKKNSSASQTSSTVTQVSGAGAATSDENGQPSAVTDSSSKTTPAAAADLSHQSSSAAEHASSTIATNSNAQTTIIEADSAQSISPLPTITIPTTELPTEPPAAATETKPLTTPTTTSPSETPAAAPPHAMTAASSSLPIAPMPSTLFAPIQPPAALPFNGDAPEFIPTPKAFHLPPGHTVFPAYINADEIGLFVWFFKGCMPSLEVEFDRKLYLTSFPAHLQLGHCQIYFNSTQIKWAIRQYTLELYPIRLTTQNQECLNIETFFTTLCANGTYQTIASNAFISFQGLEKAAISTPRL